MSVRLEIQFPAGTHGVIKVEYDEGKIMHGKQKAKKA